MNTNGHQSCYGGSASYQAKPNKGGGTSSGKGNRHSDRGSRTKGDKASQAPQQDQHSFFQKSENPAEQGAEGDKKTKTMKADPTATVRKKGFFFLKQRRSDPVLILGELFIELWPEEIADFGMRFDFDIVGKVVRHKKKSTRDPNVLWSDSGAGCTVSWRKEPERRVEEEIEQFAATGGAAFDRRPFLVAAFHRESRSFLICAVSASSFSSKKGASWEHQQRVQECFDRIEESLRATGISGFFRRRMQVRIPRATVNAAVQITPLMLELGSTEAEQQLEPVRPTSTELRPDVIGGLDDSERVIAAISATTSPNASGSDAGVRDQKKRSGRKGRRSAPLTYKNASGEEVVIPRKQGPSAFAVAVAVVCSGASEGSDDGKCSHESKREQNTQGKSGRVLVPKLFANPYFAPTGSLSLWATEPLPGWSLSSEPSAASTSISVSSCLTTMGILLGYWLKQSELLGAGTAQYYCSYVLKSPEEAKKPRKEIETQSALRRLTLHLEGFWEGSGRVFTLAPDVLPMFVDQRGASDSSKIERKNNASEGGLGLVRTDDACEAAVTRREDGTSGREEDENKNGRRRRQRVFSKLATDVFLMSPKQDWCLESIEDAATSLGAPPEGESEFVSYELSLSLVTRQLNVSTLSSAMVSQDLNLKGKEKQMPEDSQRANPSRGVLQQQRTLLKRRRVGPLGSLHSWIRYHEVAVPEICREDFDLNFWQWQCQRLLGEPHGADPICVSVPGMDAKREDEEPSPTEQQSQQGHHLPNTISTQERRQRAASLPNRGRVGFLPILNWVQAKVLDLPEAAYLFRAIALPSRRLLSYVPPPACVYDICSGFTSWVIKWMCHSFAARVAGLPDLFARMWERKLEPRPYCAVANVARFGPLWCEQLSALETQTHTAAGEMKQNADEKTRRGARQEPSPVQGLQPIRVEVFRDLDAQRIMATLMSTSGSSLTEWNNKTAIIPALKEAIIIGANPVGVKLVRDRYLDPHQLQFAREAAAGELGRGRSGRGPRGTNKSTVFDEANARHPRHPSVTRSGPGCLSLSLPLRTLFVGKDAVYDFCKWKDRRERRYVPYVPLGGPPLSSSAAAKLQEQESARLEEELLPQLESRGRDAGNACGSEAGRCAGTAQKGKKGEASSMNAESSWNNINTGTKGKKMHSSDFENGNGMGKGRDKGSKKGQEEDLGPEVVDDLPPMVIQNQMEMDAIFRHGCAGGGQQMAHVGAACHSLEDTCLLIDYMGAPYCWRPGPDTKFYCLSVWFTGRQEDLGPPVGLLY